MFSTSNRYWTNVWNSDQIYLGRTSIITHLRTFSRIYLERQSLVIINKYSESKHNLVDLSEKNKWLEQVESLNPAYKFLGLQSTHGDDANTVSFINNGFRHYETVDESNLICLKNYLELIQTLRVQTKKELAHEYFYHLQ